MSLSPGEIYWADVGNGELHRVIVVSREALNRGDYVVVVPVTSKRVKDRKGLPNSVYFRAGQHGFTKDCVAQAEAIAQIHKSYLDFETGTIGTLDSERVRELARAIGYVISAELDAV